MPLALFKVCHKVEKIVANYSSSETGTGSGSGSTTGSGSGSTTGSGSGYSKDPPNLCLIFNNLRSTCTANDGPAAGSACAFPFNFMGTTHFGCTTIDGDTRPWCSTQTDEMDDHVTGVGAWGYCDASCPVQGIVGSLVVEQKRSEFLKMR